MCRQEYWCDIPLRLFLCCQALRDIQLNDLTTHLNIFDDHREQDYEEMLHRLQDIRIEFKYPLV